MVGGVNTVSEGGDPPAAALQAMAAIRAHVGRTGWAVDAADVAILLFGGVDTAESMTAIAAHHLLSHPAALAAVRADRSLLPGAIEESLRLEPAATRVNRYATANADVGSARIRAGDLVIVSLSAANRDPAVFADPRHLRPAPGQRRRPPRVRAGPALLPRRAPSPPCSPRSP